LQHTKEERELEQQILDLADLLIESLITASMLTGEKQDQQLEISTEIVAKIAGLLEQYLGDFNEHFETLLQQLTQQKLPDKNVLSSFGDFNLLLEKTINKGLTYYKTSQNASLELNNAEIVQENAVPNTVNGSIQVEAALEKESLDESANHQLDEKSFPLEDAEVMEDYEEIDCPTVGSEIIENDSVENKGDDSEVVIPSEDESDPYKGRDFTELDNLFYLILKQSFPTVEIIKDYVIKKLTFSYYLPGLELVIDKYEPDKKESIWKDFYCRQNNLTYIKFNINEKNSLKQLIRSLNRNLATTISKDMPGN